MNQYHIYEKIGKGKYSTCYKGRRKVRSACQSVNAAHRTEQNRGRLVRTAHTLIVHTHTPRPLLASHPLPSSLTLVPHSFVAQRTIAYYAIKSVDKSQKARVLQEVCVRVCV